MQKEYFHLIYVWLIPIIWFVWMIFWFFSAKNVRSTVEREPPMSRRIHLVLLGAAFALITLPAFRWGPFRWRWLPDTLTVYFVGVAVLFAGFIFAVWARIYLGKNWSSTITVKEKHELILNGPYRFVRHPIYTGFIIGMAGSAIAVAELRGLFAFLIFVAAYLRKIRIEEKYLIAHFGQGYAAYRKSVKALIPYVL